MTTEAHRVLLVEDNELDARALTRAITADGGCIVEWVGDLASGLAAVRDEGFDCVLLDLSLPDSDGLISVETMTANSPHCPVVVLTGLDDPGVALEAVERGAQDYLVKSTITPELVVRAIGYAVARHHSEFELKTATARLENLHAREQIARDLHDTVIQRLFATGMTLQSAAGSGDTKRLVDRAIASVAEIDDVIRELREAIFGLHEIDDDTLLAHELAQIAESQRDSLGFRPAVRLGDVPPLAPEIQADLVATVWEAIANIARHAAATAASITVQFADGQVLLRISDNGRGPGRQRGSEDGGDGGRTGNGLPNMRARAERHGGGFVFHAGETGGTELTWTVPVDT